MKTQRKIIYIILCIALVFCVFKLCTNKQTSNQNTITPHTTNNDTIEYEKLVETKNSEKTSIDVVNNHCTSLVSIEDYGDSTLTDRGMTPFYESLYSGQNNERPIRIAVFGDSFIEADILTGDFRELLQKKYGGCGVGFVSITSQVNGYRPTINHSFSGWHTFAYTDKDKSKQQKQKIGISGYYFETDGFASVQLKGVNKYSSLLDTCDRVTFFLKNESPVNLGVKINNKKSSTIQINQSKRLQAQSIDGHIGAINFEVQPTDSTATFYGIAMDGKKGIIVDNYSMRGSSGLFLCTIPVGFLEEFNSVRPYDLIILQYGLNVLSNKTTDYSGYERKMISAVERLKKTFPQSGVLIMSIGDRAYKDSNTQEMATAYDNINALLEAQRSVARETGVAFWNVFEVMGGEGGMVKMVNSKPAMANKDYTHINFHGGKFIATSLYNAIIDGANHYNKKQTQL